MAVYSIGTNGTEQMILQVTSRFKVFDMVTINLRDGEIVNGEIVYIEKDKVHVTGPYRPIQKIDFKDISDINSWNPPETWR